jgi:hypothetical protein
LRAAIATRILQQTVREATSYPNGAGDSIKKTKNNIKRLLQRSNRTGQKPGDINGCVVIHAYEV